MIKFGQSGNSFLYAEAGFSDSSRSALWAKEMGLDCFEYSFGRGVNMSRQKAESIGESFKKQGIELSVHAPYFINFAGLEEDKIQNSYGYVLDSLEYAKIMGAKRVVFHPSTQGKLTREEAVNLTKQRLQVLADKIYERGFDDMLVCPETMGKSAQIGTVDEIISFCKIDKVFIPCVDFGHVNAREFGSLKTTEDYLTRLQYMVDNLGKEKMQNFHIHFSKIEYSAKGEVRHLTFEDDHYGPDFAPLSKALKILGLEPFVVCESAGTQDIDALNMQKTYYGN